MRIIIGAAVIGVLALILSQRAQTADAPATEAAAKQQAEAPNIASPREPNRAAEPPEESIRAEEAAPPQLVSVMLAGKSYSFLIAPNYLEEAKDGIREIVDTVLSEPMDFEDELERLERAFNSNNPSNIMSLRLALDPETAERFGAVLALYPELEAKRVALAKLAEQQQMVSFFQTNRELAECYFALELMNENSEFDFFDERRLFIEKAEKWALEQFDEWSKPTQTRAWHENEELIAELNTVLSPAQRQELQTYRDEKTHRETERRAYTRSLDIAERLGLNEADRGGLFEYLQEHPDATEEDIAGQLDPELRALLLD